MALFKTQWDRLQLYTASSLESTQRSAAVQGFGTNRCPRSEGSRPRPGLECAQVAGRSPGGPVLLRVPPAPINRQLRLRKPS